MRRPRSVVRAVTAVLMSVIAVGACVANSHGPNRFPQHEARVVAVGTAVPILDAPPNATAFEGLEARVKQATAEAQAAGADISIVILDRETNQLVSNGDNSPLPIASVAKLFIADDMLLQVAKGQTQISPEERNAFDIMLRSSDDSAAEVFWNRNGGSEIITRVTARYGLTSTTTPYNGRWFNTLSSAGDLVRYYDKLLAGSGGLPLEQADIIMSDLSQSTSTGIDGYPQRFGIPDGLPGVPVAVKQGWMCCWNGGNWMHMSTGVIGPGQRYVMALGALQPSSDDVARDTLTQAVKTMFPEGRI
jgi:hypothetical protein